jgi:hypothetical protein
LIERYSIVRARILRLLAVATVVIVIVTTREAKPATGKGQ